MKYILLVLLFLLPPVSAEPDTLFTPYDNGQGHERIMGLVQNAKTRIRMSVYAFTDTKLSDELIEAQRRGVDVKILADKSQSIAPYSRKVLNDLQTAGVPVDIGRSPEHGALLHAKFMVVDGIYTEDGSYNYTGKTANNQFNTLNFSSDPPRAMEFETTWARMQADIRRKRDERNKLH